MKNGVRKGVASDSHDTNLDCLELDLELEPMRLLCQSRVEGRVGIFYTVSSETFCPFWEGVFFVGLGFFEDFHFFQSILQVFGPHLDTDKGNVVLGPVLFEVFHFLEAMVIL